MYRLLRGVVITTCGAVALSAAACSTPAPAVSTTTATPTLSASATQPVPTSTATAVTTPASAAAVASFRDATYVVEGKPVALKNGLLEVEAAPGSASTITTRVFGNDASGDLNGDGQADVAFVLTQSPGGSGTFFYAVAAVKTATGYTGTNAVLLGDRIAPQTTRIVDGVIEVNYAERNPGEPMTTRPSLGVTKRLRITDGKLVEVR
ncbi:MAG: hypothetical protein WCI61_05780 [Chloroflexota bacterium]